MILKFWPWWPWKWPLNLNSLGGCLMDFILNYIFEISGFYWPKWPIGLPICLTLIIESAQARCVESTLTPIVQPWPYLDFTEKNVASAAKTPVVQWSCLSKIYGNGPDWCRAPFFLRKYNLVFILIGFINWAQASLHRRARSGLCYILQGHPTQIESFQTNPFSWLDNIPSKRKLFLGSWVVKI